MNIWILQTGEPLHIDDSSIRPMRAINLSNELVARGHKVTIISSDFDHFSKTHRNMHKGIIDINESLHIILIPSTGYSRHIGFSRLWDHFQLGFRINKAIDGLDLPHIVVIGFPPIESAWSLGRWLTKKRIPYFVDVKDAWPDIFLEVLPRKLHWIFNFLLLPYQMMSRNVMKMAQGLMAPSQLFLNWSLEKANRNQNDFDIIAPLTSPSHFPTESDIEDGIRFWNSQGLVDDGKSLVFFVGSLTRAFNFQPLIQLAKSENFRVVIAGTGPKLAELQSASKLYPNLIIPGWINQTQLFTLAKKSVFSIIPSITRKDFDMAINNKFIDSLRLGLPIITSNYSVAKHFLEPWKIGVYYEESNLEQTLTSLINDSYGLSLMRKNVLKLFNERFEHSKAYSKLVDLIESAV